MTSIDFYILGHTHQKARYSFACRLAEKAFKEGRQIYVHVADETTARKLDKLMWQYKPEAFLPHNIVGDEEIPHAPIQIGWQEHPNHHFDVLINLVSPQPSFFSRFERVLEIVIQDEAILEQSRQHYKFYRDRGYEVTHRDLRG